MNEQTDEVKGSLPQERVFQDVSEVRKVIPHDRMKQRTSGFVNLCVHHFALDALPKEKQAMRSVASLA